MLIKKYSALEAEYYKLVLLLLLIWRLVNAYYFRDDDYYFRDVGLLLKHPFGGGDTPITLVGAPSETKIYAFGYENTMPPSASLGKPRAPSELKTSALRAENVAFGSEKFYCSLRLSCRKRESHLNVRVLSTLRKSLHIVEGCCGTLYGYVRVPYVVIWISFGYIKIYAFGLTKIYCFLRFILNFVFIIHYYLYFKASMIFVLVLK